MFDLVIQKKTQPTTPKRRKMTEKIMWEQECPNCKKIIQRVRTRRGYCREYKTTHRVALKWVKAKYEVRIKKITLKGQI